MVRKDETILRILVWEPDVNQRSELLKLRNAPIMKVVSTIEELMGSINNGWPANVVIVPAEIFGAWELASDYVMSRVLLAMLCRQKDIVMLEHRMTVCFDRDCWEHDNTDDNKKQHIHTQVWTSSLNCRVARPGDYRVVSLPKDHLLFSFDTVLVDYGDEAIKWEVIDWQTIFRCATGAYNDLVKRRGTAG